MLRQRAKRLGLLLVLFGFAVLLTALGVWRFGSWIGFFLVYSWMLDALTSYGLNSHLAAIISVAAGLMVWAGAVYLWKRNRRWGLVIIAALMMLQSAFLFCLEKNRYFSAKNGEPIKYYSVNPLSREIQVFDRPVYDAFGQRAQPVTFPIAQEIARQKHRERFPNEEVRPERIKNYFDPRTGEPLAYWCRDSRGDIHLFLRGGFDNKSGQRLKPVTEEVVEEALAQAAKLRQEAIPSPQPQQEAASPSQPPQKAVEVAEEVSSPTTTPPWKTIQLGTYKSVEGLRIALLDAGYNIRPRGGDILKRVVLATEPTEVALVRATVAELGFPEGASRERIYEAGLKRGWQLCPAEVGPQLLLQYSGQPDDEEDIIAMEPIVDSYGTPRVFDVFLDDDGPRLGGRRHPPYAWYGRHRLVFRLK